MLVDWLDGAEPNDTGVYAVVDNTEFAGTVQLGAVPEPEGGSYGSIRED